MEPRETAAVVADRLLAKAEEERCLGQRAEATGDARGTQRHHGAAWAYTSSREILKEAFGL